MRKLKKVRELAQGYVASRKWLHWGLHLDLARCQGPVTPYHAYTDMETERLRLGI